MCLPRDEHFLSLVVDAPQELPIARVRWLTGKADRDYSAHRIQRDLAPSHLPRFDSHFQLKMRLCEEGHSLVNCQWQCRGQGTGGEGGGA